jgi:L-alanine-DL-glutamate epimerase-like enolase superfamily enzyme
MKLRFERVETFVIHVPSRSDFRWLSLSRPLGEFVLLRARAAGVEGWGEVVALRDWGSYDGRRHGETSSTVSAVVHEQFVPWLLESEFELGELSARLDELVVGHPYAKALVDIAAHDLAGKLRGVPVYELLGGAARTAVPVAHMIGLMPVNEGLSEGMTAIEDGVSALQVKGGQDPARDVELVAALRRELGDSVMIRVDANGGYGERSLARRTLAELGDAGATLVEQPTLDVDLLHELRMTSPLPLMADESCWTPADALELLRRRAVDLWSVYVGKPGGIARAREVCAIAAAARVPHDLNGALELGIGNAANLHVALASPAELLPSVIPVNAPAGAVSTTTAGRYFQDDVVEAAFPFERGSLLLVDAPGLGVDVDVEKVERYCIDRRESVSTSHGAST